ncbi:unnamed protein product, partial [Sphagnum jensenii]
MDLCGPLLTMSLKRSKHFAMFTNNCTRYMGIFLQENIRNFKKINQRCLKMWGCEAFMHIPKSIKNKLQPKI